MPANVNDPSGNLGKVDICTFWGKAQPRDVDGLKWHPLVYHSLDVAAVGHVLMNDWPELARRTTGLLGLPRSEGDRVIRFLLCLHDIGKFAKKFQAKVPDRFPKCFQDDLTRIATAYDHASGGMHLYRRQPDMFRLPKKTHRRVWLRLISAVTGHHGAPPQVPEGDLIADFGRAGFEAAAAFIEQVHAVLGFPADIALDERQVRRASFAIAGLAVLADWIGSNQEWFSYREPMDGIDAYWEEAVSRATTAVAQAGVLPAEPSRMLTYPELLGVKASPSPMQAWARDVDLPPGPALYVIEDETGSGKTEAAVLLAHRLMASGRGSGFYVALPTMATANAMFARLEKVVRRLFAPHAAPSVALAHGARDMHGGFRAAKLRGGRHEKAYADGGGSLEASETTASSACAAWIADDRRRAFLADAGAGTIDQALLAVLPTRHQSVRLLGLACGVLILDEVHAYDAYMQREMETLLEFQAALGGSAVLLSATLPLATRRRLVEAFARGLGEQASNEHDPVDYPLATVCAAGVLDHHSVEARPERTRKLPVRFLSSPEEAFGEIDRAASAGKAVLYIRNTVDDAVEAYSTLKSRGQGDRLHLFHARYALVDRLATEQHVVRMFGKDSRGEDRRGRVLVATQVVEQSLDLDFDVLITDLAPIDLVIQRAGRLWRHVRQDRDGTPELLVVGPQPSRVADEKWYSRAFPRAAYVYPDHARLWLTADMLLRAGAIHSPTELRTLIEAVYGVGVEECVPDALRPLLYDAEGRAGAERSVAGTNVLDCSKGYVRDGGAWDRDVRTPTRLVDDPQVVLRLALLVDGKIVPYARDAAGGERWRAWRLSEVSVSERRVGGEALASGQAAVAQTAKADWTRYDEDKPLVVLKESPADGCFHGTAAGRDEKGVVQLRYSRSEGLTLAPVPRS